MSPSVSRPCTSGSAYHLESPWQPRQARRACVRRAQQLRCRAASTVDKAEQWWNDAYDPSSDVQVQGLDRLQETLDSSIPLPISDSDAESRQFALAMLRIALDTKASDPVVLHVAPMVSWTSYLVIVTVQSRPQLGAILAKAEKAAKESFDRRPSGTAASRSPWEVLDFGDVIVHLFSPEERQYYSLEEFYEGAPVVDVSHLLAAPLPPQWNTRQGV